MLFLPLSSKGIDTDFQDTSQSIPRPCQIHDGNANGRYQLFIRNPSAIGTLRLSCQGEEREGGTCTTVHFVIASCRVLAAKDIPALRTAAKAQMFTRAALGCCDFTGNVAKTRQGCLKPEAPQRRSVQGSPQRRLKVSAPTAFRESVPGICCQ